MPIVQTLLRLALCPTLVCVAALTPSAQETPANPPTAAPGVITGGSSTTSIGGLPAARKGDTTDSGGPIVEGSKNVFIGGKPAAVLGDRTGCGGVAIGTGGGVFINGKPAARAGDLTTGCPGK